MKIAIVINTSWNIYNYRMGLVKALLEAGHEVVAIAPKDDYSEQLIAAGCEYIPIEIDNWGTNLIRDYKLIRDFKKTYRKVAPDVIMHYTIKPNIYGSVAAHSLGIPSMCNVSGLGTVFMKDDLISKLVKKMYRYSFKYPTRVFFQNEADVDFFLKNRLLDKEKITILPGSGVNTQHFAPSNHQNRDKFTFLMISRLLYDKGIVEFVEASKQIKSNGKVIDFQILGGIDPGHVRGIPQEMIQKWVAEGTINYLGTATDVRPHIQQADCVVLPSYREGTPRTLLEAASMAKPLLATDVPGCNSVVENEVNGLLCAPKNIDDLAQKMKSMIKKSDEERAEFGRKAREMVKLKFDEQIVIDQYFTALKQLS